jgi:hypothetical protein
MSKKTIDMVAIQTKKANAQNLTCFIAFVATAALAAILMVVACIIPTVVTTTEITCWICMALEALAICLGFVSYWIKTNALGDEVK